MSCSTSISAASWSQTVEAFNTDTLLQRSILPLGTQTITNNLPLLNKDQDSEAAVLATDTDAFVIVRGTEGEFGLGSDWINTNADIVDTQIG